MMDRTFSCPISNDDMADITENPNPSSTSAVVRRSVVNVAGGQSSSLDSATSKTRGASVSASAGSGSAKKGSVAFKHAGSMDSGRLRSLYFRTKSESMGAPSGQGSKMSDEVSENLRNQSHLMLQLVM